MLPQISNPYVQSLLCKKRERYLFNFPYPMLYPNNIIPQNYFKNESKTNIEGNKNINYQCNDGCHISFKSLQKKIAHHNRLDDECNKEKVNLYILLNEFQNCIHKLNENNKFENCNEYRVMERQYKKSKNYALDKNQWNNFLN